MNHDEKMNVLAERWQQDDAMQQALDAVRKMADKSGLWVKHDGDHLTAYYRK